MRRAVALVTVVGLAGAGCQRATPPPRFAGGVETALEVERGTLLVPAWLDGKRHVLVVDTGASITSLTTATARGLGITPTSTLPINGEVAASGTLRSLAIGTVDVADLRVAIVDLPIARRVDARFDGILGLDVLARHDIVVDRTRETLALYPVGSLARIAATAGMARVDVHRGPHGLLVLPIELDGHRAIPAILDLGSPFTIVNRAAAEMLGARELAHMWRPRKASVGGTRLRLGYVGLDELAVFARFGLAERPAILLGANAFRWHVLAISVRDGVAYLSR